MNQPDQIAGQITTTTTATATVVALNAVHVVNTRGQIYTKRPTQHIIVEIVRVQTRENRP